MEESCSDVARSACLNTVIKLCVRLREDSCMFCTTTMKDSINDVLQVVISGQAPYVVYNAKSSLSIRQASPIQMTKIHGV